MTDNHSCYFALFIFSHSLYFVPFCLRICRIIVVYRIKAFRDVYCVCQFVIIKGNDHVNVPLFAFEIKKKISNESADFKPATTVESCKHNIDMSSPFKLIWLANSGSFTQPFIYRGR